MSNVLEMKNIRKEFPGVIALDDVSLTLEKGEILALLGENGAGKSTLMKVLSGTYQPDLGQISIRGDISIINSPIHADELGIAIIHQELSVVPNMTVAENIFALKEPTRFGIIDDKEMNRKAAELLKQLNMNINPSVLVGSLSVSQQQMVEIAKSLSTNPDILIMDEPTSALSNNETRNLLEITQKLAKSGISIIYISHKLEEIFTISDRITVIRDGKAVGDLITKDSNADELVSLMVGREMNNVYPVKPFRYAEDSKLLEVVNYTKKDWYHDINLFVRPGEILGLYGLMGSGRSEIAQGIFGIEKKDSGKLLISGVEVKINNSTDAIKNKIAFVTEDRKQQGLVLSGDIKENISMASIKNILNKFNLIDTKEEVEKAEKYIESLRIKTPSYDQYTNNLSGGNQQKVVLAKWFEIEPKILILDEPTRGIDVGSKYEIYELIIELARSGLAVILISSDLPEVLNMSDRMHVIRDKTIIAELNPKTTKQEEVMSIITKEESIYE